MLRSMLSVFQPSSWLGGVGGVDYDDDVSRSAAVADMEERAASLNRTTRNALADEIEREVVGVVGQQAAAEGATDAPTTTQAEEDARTLAELDAALDESRGSLVRMERRCDFVAERLDAYRRRLHERRRVLMTTGFGGGGGGTDDVEGERPQVSSAVEMGDAPGGGEVAPASTTLSAGGGTPVEEEEGRSLLPPSPSAAATREPTQEEIRNYHEKEAHLEEVERIYRELVLDVAKVRDRIDSMERQRAEIRHGREECRRFVVAAALAEGRERDLDYVEEEFGHPSAGLDEEGAGGIGSGGVAA